MADFIAKPTIKKPVSDQSKNYEKNFNKETTMHGLNLNEVDGMLNEKEMSLKKKIFSLPKMEALVHPDPKLSAVYNKMAEDGEEKYGYHYNETIMNIIFNDYVLNSPKYLQKYKMAVPKKKKRRDKSGIRQLQKAAEKKIEQSRKIDREKGITENVGGIRVKFLVHPDNPEVFAYFPDENHDASGKYKMGYSHVGQHSAVDPQYAAESRPATPEEYDELKNELEQHVGYNLDIIENFSGEKPAVGDIEETSTTGSVGGSGMGSGGYATPHAWGGGDLSKGMKKQKPAIRKPIWKGGTIIQESNYLLETDGFEKYYNMLNEFEDLDEKSTSKAQQRFMGMVRGVQKGDVNPKDVSQKVRKTAKEMKPEDVKDFASTKHEKLPEKINENMNKISTPEELKSYVTDKKARTGKGLTKEDIPMLAGQALYNVAVKTADNMLPMPWEHLPDINSMWDYIDENGGMTYENFIESVKEAVNDRLEEDGFSLDDLMETEINETLQDNGNQNFDSTKPFYLLDRNSNKYLNKWFKTYDDAKKHYDTIYSQSDKWYPGKFNFEITQIEPQGNVMENVVNEHHLDNKEDKIKFIINALNKIDPEPPLIDVLKATYHISKWTDEKIDDTYKRAEAKLNELGIDPMSIKITEEIMNEHHLNTKEEKINFIFAADKAIDEKKPLTPNEINVYKKIMSKWTDEKVDDIYKRAEAKLTELGIDPMSIHINEETDQTMISGNPESMANKPRPEGEFGGGVPMGMQDSGGLRESEDDGWWDDAGEKAFASMEDDDGNIFNPKEESEKDEDEIDLDSNPDVDDDINKDAHKMDWKKVKAQNEKPLRIDRFMKTTDGREMFEEINEELEAFSIHQNKLKSIMEDKKPSSLVLKDRLGKENASNFKSDMQKGTTKDAVKMEKDMMWKDQQTNVGDNPYKNGEDLEKAAIKTTQGNALKNVGNSDGTKGEIPKRNLTTKEQEDVDEYRLGQQDLVYDNAPDEKFEERMKAGMGEEMYKKRQEKLKKRAEYPMYNKEEQPVGDTAVDKVQFNKEKSGWNEREGLKESVLTGKYINELNKRKLVDFKLSDVKIVESVNDMFKVDFTGMGNSTDSRGNVNEAIDNVIDSHKFYTDGKTVVAIKNPVRKLNEGDEKKKPIVSEEVNKMKHLLGYDPKSYVDAKRNKI